MTDSIPSLRVACLGDSITGAVPGKPYLHQYVKWSDLLQLILETHLGIGRVTVTNCGHAGHTSSQSLPRVQEQVLPVNPDIVIVLLGANDFGNKTEPAKASAQLRENLTAIVHQLKTAGITKILLLQYPEPKADDMSQVWTHADKGNPVVASVAAGENLPTLELAPAFRDAAATRPLVELVHGVDGIHLNPYGEIVVARTVFTKLKALGWIQGVS